jgi:hypothetical protein
VSGDGATNSSLGTTTESLALDGIVTGTGLFEVPTGQTYNVEHCFEGGIIRVDMGGGGKFKPTDSNQTQPLTAAAISW